MTRRLPFLAALLALGGLGPGGARVHAQEAFSLDDVLAAPFASDLVAAPTGAAFAWVRYERGARNVWVATEPDFRGRRVTDWIEDDGQELGSLRFTPDGRRVVFVRGGAPNRRGEIPNPTSAPDPAERALWIVPVDGGPARRLATGASPAISPDGEILAYVEGGQVYTVSLNGDDVTPSRWFQIRGTAGSPTWSPDGTRLAFTSDRGDHAYVGVFDPADRSVTWLDPGLDRDGSPVWSPDGTEIAFLRIPNERRRLPFEPARAGLPWSLRVADAVTGAGREVWRADEGRGSVFHGVAGPQIVWMATNDLVFPWERDGWTHLYAVASGGGPARLLTPGAFEVEEVRPAPDRSWIAFSSNQDDIDRRHLWAVAPGDAAPRRLTGGEGIEWSPAPAASGGVWAYLASDATTPAHAEILTGDAPPRPLVRGFVPETFPADRLVTPRQVVFETDDGLRIHGQLFLPPGAEAHDRRPAAIFFHGGSRRQMLLGWHYLRYYHNAYAFNQYLASRGYVVLSVNYRSGIGYGLEFREALDYGARGASEYRDVLAARRYLATRGDVDPARIALWGGSYGGYLTALGLARDSHLFAAGVDLHGVHDWNVVIRNFVPSYDAERRAAFSRTAFESSPMAAIDGWRSPVLLIHGDDDRNVPFSESVDLAEALRRRGVEMEEIVFPDEVHGFLLHRSWLAAYRGAAAFLDAHLGGPVAVRSGG